MSYRWRTIDSLKSLTPAEIEVCFANADTPFNSYAFLANLESSGSVGEGTGWLPHHQLLETDGQAIGLLIGYLKTHSYGEYVFDWSWAEAYHRNGIDYYPKHLLAIPFTPVPANKWLSQSEMTEGEALSLFFDQLSPSKLSGIHLNYPANAIELDSNTWIKRSGNQFHWFNINKQNQGRYEDFDDFLSTLTARKRKNIIKERRKIADAGINCIWRTGSEVTSDELDAFYQFYQSTYYKRGQQGYLNRIFFKHIFEQMDHCVRLLMCYHQDQAVAAALYFASSDTLFGRYWGSLQEYDGLHFEACYYQGIEHCIEHGIDVFNPGTQGEHKIARGFEPVETLSYHHLFLPPFQQAVARFCQEERQYNKEYMHACSERLPFKQVL